MMHDKIEDETLSRSAMYALVSRMMLSEVDKAFIDEIEKNKAILDMLPNYRDWEKRETIDTETLIEQYYNVDFANLFIMHLVPYESFYTRDDQMVESGGDNPVLKLYNNLDFRVKLSEARVVSPDHIGVELEFMYMLNKALSKALEAKDMQGACELLQAQYEFLKEHLLEWAPMFLINVKRESRTPLYHDGSELTLEFLLSDFEYITDKLQTLCNKKIDNQT